MKPIATTNQARARTTRAGIALLFLVAIMFSALLFHVDNAVAAQTNLTAGKAALSSKVSTASVAANVKGKANSVTVFRYGLVDLERYYVAAKSYSAYDVTGDARPDTLKVSVSPRGDTGIFSSLVVSVNGSSALTMRAPEGGYDQATVSVLTLRNGKPFLFVSTYAIDGTANQMLLVYRGGRFLKVAGNDLLLREGTSNAYISHVRPVANRIVVQYEFTSTVTGFTRTSFTYAWKASSGLTRTSNQSMALRFATTSDGEYTKQARKAAASFGVFANTALTKKVASVKKGAKARPLGVCLSGKNLLYKVQVGKKIGWVKCCSANAYAGGKLFQGVYGCVPLSNNVPAYTKKALGIGYLGRYSNHALYIARNEVYARHGLKYSTAELKAYYSTMGWYKPSSSKVTLSKVETKNVTLMLAIERNRNSPYV